MLEVSPDQLKLPSTADSIKEPVTPNAAASVGVAIP